MDKIEKKEYDRKRYLEKKDHYKEIHSEYYKKNRNKLIKVTSKYHSENKEKIRNRMKRWRDNNPLIQEAYNKSKNLKIPKGHICKRIGCKNLATERHHPDYTKPTFLDFLCHECHMAEHRRKQNR